MKSLERLPLRFVVSDISHSPDACRGIDQWIAEDTRLGAR
jgi:hypothetical protein